MNSSISSRESLRRITPGAVLGWLLFSFVTLTIGIMALPGAGRFYDFREFYAAGYLLFQHPTQLFSLSVQEATQNALVYPLRGVVPFYHPAYEALLYAPFTLLSYRHAYIAFAIVNLLLLALCYCLAPTAADPRIARIPRPFLIFLCFPAFMAILQGQDSIAAFLLLCLTWRALASGRDRSAGIFLALCLFKLQIAVVLLFFLAVYLPAERRVRLLRSFVSVTAAVALVCLLITGPQGMATWFHLVALSALASHQSHYSQAAITVYAKGMPTLNGLLFVCGGHLLPPHISFALYAILFVLVFAAALYLCRTARCLSDAFCAALAAALVLAPHLFLYDYVLLLLPVLILTQAQQPLFTALFYLLNYALFAVSGIYWFALMAIVPLLLLAMLLVQRNAFTSDTEKVTPHPLTALN